MGKVLIILGEIIGIVTFLATAFLVFVEYGFWWGVVALLIPPADLVFMFFVGTWVPGLLAMILYGIGVGISKD